MAYTMNFDDAVFTSYAFYVTLVTLKLLIMSPLTGLYRMTNKSFANPEDGANFHVKVNKNDPQVERIRRAHLNDLENIPAFWVIGFLYTLTNPSPFVAMSCFRLFAGARITHSVMYLAGIFPIRALCFFIGIAVNFFMGINVLLYLL